MAKGGRRGDLLRPTRMREFGPADNRRYGRCRYSSRRWESSAEPRLDRLHFARQSWGGMLAMEYALTQPLGVASLTIGLVAGQHDPVGGRGEPPAGSLPRDVQDNTLQATPTKARRHDRTPVSISRR